MNRAPVALALAALLAACSPSPDDGSPADGSSMTAPVSADAEQAAPGTAAVAEPAAAACAIAAEASALDAEGRPTHPRLAVETLDHGCFDLAQQRGSWVVVNFWATWCKPCLKEIPDLSAFDAAREDVRVIGLAYEEIEPQALRDFLVEHPAGYPIAIVDVYAPPADFETPRGLPLTILIAPDGSVGKRFLGPVTSQELAEAIAAATP